MKLCTTKTYFNFIRSIALYSMICIAHLTLIGCGIDKLDLDLDEEHDLSTQLESLTEEHDILSELTDEISSKDSICLQDLLEIAGQDRDSLNDAVIMSILLAQEIFIGESIVIDCYTQDQFSRLSDLANENSDLNHGVTQSSQGRTLVDQIMSRLVEIPQGQGQEEEQASEIVILIDSTGSMSGDIKQVEKEVNRILEQAQAQNSKIGVATFGDKNVDSPWFSSNFKLYKNYDNARQYIKKNLVSTGGGDWPESRGQKYLAHYGRRAIRRSGRKACLLARWRYACRRMDQCDGCSPHHLTLG